MEEKTWFTLKELSEYIPGNPGVQAIYGWVRDGVIPYYKPKGTKRLLFLKSEIDEWLKSK